MAENEITFERIARAKNAIAKCYTSVKNLLCSYERFENLCENIALISMFDYVNDCAKSMYYYSDKIIEQTKNFINTKDFNDAEKILAFCYDKNLQIKDILKNSLSRSHAKGYFISGLILLFTSLIIPFKIYYVVFSSVLFILSILCKFKPSPPNTNTLF